MAAAGFNTVRIPHTTPPRELLDVAQECGLKVMVGLSAEQYVGYLIDRDREFSLEAVIRDKVKSSVGHPALLCYGIGNEIPAPVARWIGREKIERYLRRVADVVREADPDALLTYVNYPSTEYLDLPFLDLLSFNVYLEERESLEAYLARLQNLAGNRPLLISELGLDSLRNGNLGQANFLHWQLHSVFEAGCAGAVVFAWTDEWFRGGGEVDDWCFGLTTAERQPKPALAVATRVFAEVPGRRRADSPRFTVVVCTHNGARTLPQCLEGVLALDYPNFEVIVVDDGSTDDTPRILRGFDVHVITTGNRGLSNARNLGLDAASGEIVAYIDDDAYPDPDWLTYLASTFDSQDVAAVGGPNIPPRDQGFTASCIARAPGGPAHILLDDRTAEHVPGCNMAFRRSRLDAIGGFDPRFRSAGDDVDVCWRILEKGWKIGFSPAALVWHHSRRSVRGWWKQQTGYGKAEALLEPKWPAKYNELGHATWQGKVYGPGLTLPLPVRRPRVYHGVWGTAPFQQRCDPQPNFFLSLLMAPEYHFLTLLLAGLSILGIAWQPLLWCLPVLLLAVGLPAAQALISATKAVDATSRSTGWNRLREVMLTASLHFLHPLARLTGRLRFGLSPFRLRGYGKARFWPFAFSKARWTRSWKDPQARLEELEGSLREDGGLVSRGGEFDRFDLEVRCGPLGRARCLMICEDQGSGTQYLRFRAWPMASLAGTAAILSLLALGGLAILDGAPIPGAIVAAGGLLLAALRYLSAGSALSLLRKAGDRAVDSD